LPDLSEAARTKDDQDDHQNLERAGAMSLPTFSRERLTPRLT
jgi:hypothetical protein